MPGQRNPESGRRVDSPSCLSLHASPGRLTAAAVCMGAATHAASSGSSQAHSLSTPSAATRNYRFLTFGCLSSAPQRSNDARTIQPAPAFQVARALRRAIDELKAADWGNQASGGLPQDTTVPVAPEPRHRWRLLPRRRVTPGRSLGLGGVERAHATGGGVPGGRPLGRRLAAAAGA